MTQTERHQFILDLLKQGGSVNVSLLSSKLKVSSVTIRKDLAILEEKNLLYRTHGGAVLIDPYIPTRHVSEKQNINPEEKRRIGVEAVKLLNDKDAILIASGTTVQAFARCIPEDIRLTVITSAMNVAVDLLGKPNIEVVQLGGIVRHTSSSVVGKYAESMLGNFSCSKLFLGVDGIDLDYGLTTTNLMEASLNRAMAEASHKTIVLADSSKFGFRGFSKICDIDCVDQIITDDGIQAKTAARLEDMGIKVTIV